MIDLRKDQGFNWMKSGKEVIKYYNIVGVSSDNDYVPLYAPFVNKGVYNKQIVHFSLPHEDNYNRQLITTYLKLYRALDNSTRTTKFRTKSMSFTLLAIKGAIFEKISNTKVELLFSVAVKEDYMSQMFKESTRDKSKFVMLVSSKFSSDPRFKTIYRKVYKELIIPKLEEGYDIVITNNIVDKCFQNKVKLPKFKKITDLKDYLHAFNLDLI